MNRARGVAIIGHGMATSRTSDEGWRSPLQLQAEACRLAMRSANVSGRDIDILLTARAPAAFKVAQFNLRLVTELQVMPALTTEVTTHGAGALGMLQLGAIALESTVGDFALCSSGGGPHPASNLVASLGITEADPQFEAPFRPTAPALYALAMRRYMYETGTTKEQCAKVAVECRRWGIRHPLAMMRDRGEITVDDVLRSPMIASPLNRLDCAPLITDGIANAFVLGRTEAIGDHTDEPIRLIGFGQRTTHDWITERLGSEGYPRAGDPPNLSYTGAWSAARDAFAMADVTPRDIDLVQTSAPFSFFALMMLEELGFCDRGEGGAFVDDGGIDLEAGLPFNTSGGSLSFGQSAQGTYLLEETIEQLLGRARGHQVVGARIGVVHGHGGPLGSHAVVVVSRE